MSELFLILTPEFIVLSLIVFELLSELFMQQSLYWVRTWTGAFGLTAAFCELLILRNGPLPVAVGGFVLDELSVYFKVIILLIAGFQIVLTHNKMNRSLLRCHYFTLISMSLVSTVDFVNLFAILGVCSLGMGLAGVSDTNSSASWRLAMRRIFLGILPISFMVGLLVLVMRTGLEPSQLSKEWTSTFLEGLPARGGLLIFFLIMVASFFTSIFPMHHTAGDTSRAKIDFSWISLHMIVPVSIAGVLIRFLGGWFVGLGAGSESQWQTLLLFSTVVSMGVGAALVFNERDIRRIMAAVLIFQFGLIVLGIGILTEKGVSAALYSIASDSIGLLLLFVACQSITKNGQYNIDKIKDTLHSSQLLSLLFALCVVGGLPPFPGFVSRFLLVGAALELGLDWIVFFALIAQGLLLVGLGTIFLKLFTALRARADMIQSDKESATNRRDSLVTISLLFLAVASTAFSGAIIDVASQAYRILLWS